MFKININLERFSVIELVSLIVTITICLAVLSTIAVGLFRQMRLEVIEHVYLLLAQMLALVAGLLGGGAIGYTVAKSTVDSDKLNNNKK